MEAQNITEEIDYPIIQVEEPEYCKLKVHYEADPEVVEGKLDDALAALRGLKIPGFRKGKAPDHAIKTKLKPQINQYIAREMATHAIDDIVFETDIKPIGRPSYSNINIKGKKFSCDIELYKKPEFDLGNIKFEVPKPDLEADEDTLAERSLLNLRMRLGEVEPYDEDDTVSVNDQVTLSWEATIDGEEFEGSKVEGEMYQVGQSKWAGFDDYLIGMKADETRDFEFIFEDGPNEGKTAKFSVTIHMGTKRKPHPVDDEFLKKTGMESADKVLEKLKSIARDTLNRQLNEAVRNQVAIKLVEEHQFEVPKFMVENEARNIAAQGAGMNFDDLSDTEKEVFIDQSTKNIRLNLILDSIRESEPDSVLNDGEAQQRIIQHLQSQGQNPKEIFNNPQTQPLIMQMIGSAKDEFTLQWVADQATIIE